MPNILKPIILSDELSLAVDEEVINFIDLLNDFIDWINRYDKLTTIQNLNSLKEKLELIAEPATRFKTIREELRKTVQVKQNIEQRKKVASLASNVSDLSILTAVDLCAIYNGVRSVEYSLSILIKTLEQNSAKFTKITSFLHENLSHIVAQKIALIKSMSDRLKIIVENEQANREVEADAQSSITNSAIGSIIVLSQENSTILDESFVQIKPQALPFHADLLPMSQSQLDDSIGRFMPVDIFIMPIFPSKKINDDLNLTVHDYFVDQVSLYLDPSELNSGHTKILREPAPEITIINQAFANGLNSRSWLSLIGAKMVSGLRCFDEIMLKSVRDLVSKKPSSQELFNNNQSFSTIEKSFVEVDSEELIDISKTSEEACSNNFGLDSSFNVIPDMQSSMIASAQKGIAAYLINNGSHLNFFVKLFDGDRGKNRAQQYQKLFNDFADPRNSENQIERSKIQTAILTALMMSHDGKTLQEYILKNINQQAIVEAVRIHRVLPEEQDNKLEQNIKLDLKTLRKQLCEVIRDYLGNDANKIDRFNQDFLGPFIKNINRNNPIPEAVYDCLAEIMNIDQEIVATYKTPIGYKI